MLRAFASLHPARLRRLDHYYLSLLAAAEGTLLPELYELYGEATFDLIDRFGGMTIAIPTRDKLEGAVTDVTLHVELSRCSKRREREVVAARYGMSLYDACGRSDRVKELIQGVGR